jgi:hypothetical protein
VISKTSCRLGDKWTRIDRLARSSFDLFAIVKQIVDAKAEFRSLAEPWADTGTSTGRLMLGILGGLADVERDLIRTRTAEGRSRAKAQGKHMGRKPKLTHRSSRKRPASGAQKGPRSKNWPRLTMSGGRRFRGSVKSVREMSKPAGHFSAPLVVVSLCHPGTGYPDGDMPTPEPKVEADRRLNQVHLVLHLQC